MEPEIDDVPIAAPEAAVIDEHGDPLILEDDKSLSSHHDDLPTDNVDESGLPTFQNVSEADKVDQPDAPPADEQHAQRIGRTATYFNLINTLVGAGIVSVPATFTSCGVGSTIMLLILSAYLCFFGGVTLIGIQRETGSKGIAEMAYRVLGKWAQHTVSIFQLIFCLSCTVAYLIIGSNQVVSWLKLAKLNMDGLWKWALVVIIYLCVLPGLMTFPRHMSCLSKFAIPSVLGVVLYFIAILIRASQALSKPDMPPDHTVGIDFGMGLFTAFGVHALTFSLQVVMMPIITPYNPSVRKRVRIIGYTFMSCFLIIVIPGLLGYLMYGQETASDVLSSFPDDDILMVFVRIGMFISVSASYPAIVVSMVASIGGMAWNENLPEEMPTKHRLILIPAINLVNLVIAIFLQDIKPILGVGGALGGCIVGFVFPSLCRLVMKTYPLKSWISILHMCFVGFGIIAAILCTYSSIKDAIAAFSKK
ncbi:Transmembrane amino acid transporter protein [Trichomonas vaginalis G3]|uniref:Transmembrane amino acid transporter protein n=1 Tax=Trichomonas vaginalis (strain ATCC PRA-98 / G3) TaxID=412133 RepID=A2DR17_TRIV3|nr:amino acid transmembrane transporter protein [Trichomonas vaginalis G3]EAY17116.1 Transmembrane amino acid transporter protein [Trichomonas vaginalis G3]KAI5508826.1 amino acid transmembrane transporter protein [Trichomonas vaginalis G3]|eukprot:XP_001329339.1 Transmembrane amino acid transporter protein [Trichomonas vaginalis G3]